MPPELGMRLGPLALRNPLICGSGEHVSTLGHLRAAVDAGAAAVVAKSANESDAGRRQADATAWTYVGDDRREADPAAPPRSASLLNRSGLVQQPWEDWLATLAQADAYAAGHGAWVVPSIIPGDARELPRLAADAQAAGLRWIELNLSAPHAGEAAPGAIERPGDPARAAELTAAVRDAVSVPLTVKVGAEHHDVVAVARAVRDAGADAVVMVGRHMGFLPDLETRRAILGSFGGYSGPWALPLALRWVAKTRASLGPDVPIVGTNGARDGRDIARFLLSGATAVQVASSVIAEGFGALTRMLDELSAYLGSQGLDARDLVGEAADAVMTYQEAAMRSTP